MQRLFEGDAGELRRLLDVWEKAEPVRTRSATSTASCGGTGRRGPVLQPRGQLTVCNIWNELNWQEWVPADVKNIGKHGIAARTWCEHSENPLQRRRTQAMI